MDKVTSADKSIKIYEGYQHVMVKVSLWFKMCTRERSSSDAGHQVVGGKAEEADFARNSAVLNDWKEWLLQRA